MTSIGVGFIILAFGSDEQRKKYLPALAKGEKLGAFALVEPSGGTNWQMTLQTRAVADGDEYVVNGSKCFTSNTGEADTYTVFARTDPAKGPMGISVLIIEKDTPGFSFGTLEDKFGVRGDPTGELFFEDCRVPKENLVGQEGDGVKIFQAMGLWIALGRPLYA
jgi:butyryl-CoA dehydrogenase